MHARPRGAILAALAMLFGIGKEQKIPAAFHRVDKRPASTPHFRSRGRWGQGKKRYMAVIDGKRVPLDPGSPRPAAKFLPNVKGKRWDHGQLIPRPRNPHG